MVRILSADGEELQMLSTDYHNMDGHPVTIVPDDTGEGRHTDWRHRDIGQRDLLFMIITEEDLLLRRHIRSIPL